MVSTGVVGAFLAKDVLGKIAVLWLTAPKRNAAERNALV